MYQHGKPARSKFSLAASLLILIIVIALMAAAFWFLVRKDSGFELRNNSQPLVKQIRAGGDNYLSVNKPLFSMTLAGRWKESPTEPHAGYQAMQWNSIDPKSTNRWIRVYIDTIPSNFAVNYLLPVEAAGNRLHTEQMSDNCVTFTEGATGNPERDVSTPNSLTILPARWQKVNFLCDNSHVSHQVVGTGSSEGINTVSVNGSKHGRHRYFFVYRDDNFRPDYSIFINILASFRAK